MIAPRLAAAFALACSACGPVDAAHDLAHVPDVTAGAPVDDALDLASLALVDDGPFLGAEGAAIVPCGDGGVVHEGGRVEVRTQWCDPADLAAVVPIDLPVGTVVDFQLSHDALLSEGDVHLAVVVGDEVVWELVRTLPVAAAFFHERIALAETHAAGERVDVHIHNHGANAYAIHDVHFTSP